MAATIDRPSASAPRGRWPAFLHAAAFALFLGAVLGDWAYAKSYEIQWSNFASWLVVGGMVFLGIALVLALVDLIRGVRAWAYFVLVLAAFVLGLVNAFVHAGDAWSIMPAAMVLSVLVLVLVGAAAWIAFTGWEHVRAGARP